MNRDAGSDQPAHQGASPGPLFAGKSLSLTTFKRDGAAVATPVWFVADNGRRGRMSYLGLAVTNERLFRWG